MYGHFGNQVFHWIHYGFAFFCLYIGIPRLVFDLPSDRKVERTFAFAIRAVMWMIVLAYILIITKLFEMLALLAILLVFSLRKSLFSPDNTRRGDSVFAIGKFFYNWADGQASLKTSGMRRLLAFRDKLINFKVSFSIKALEYGLLTVVLVISGYIRLYDVVRNPSPAMSDAYVTMAWMKYADERLLFVDGIYPQGYYYVLDYLHKFAAIDSLYVLRFTGPVTNILIVFCLYFIVSRLSANRLAGIAAAAMLGLFGDLLGGGWDRQAASLSQEFGFLIVLPTLFFFYRWMVEKKEADFRTGVVGAAAVGLVHAIGFGFLWLGGGALAVAELFLRPKPGMKRFLKWFFAGTISGVIAILPAVIGLVVGKHFHANSLNFTFEESLVVRPPIRIIDWIALFSAALLLVSSLRGSFEKRFADLFISVFGFGIFILYEFVGWITQKDMISARSPDLWAIMIPLLCGMAIARMLGWIGSFRYNQFCFAGIFSLVLIAGTIVHPPKPIFPDKLESDEGLNQYLRIDQSFTPKSWTIVYSFREGNNMVRGSGYYMYVGPKIGDFDAPTYFLGVYDPTKPGLTRYGEKKVDTRIGQDVFIFYEKHVYKNEALLQLKTEVGKAKEYKTRETDMVELKKWLELYERSNGKIEVYYDGPTLTVYHIHIIEKSKPVNE
ncbi:hypothetical protein [Cohnella candidum]|uniref:Glycosyltransferase RgtA/B/C/D-like domain-containing protein n=1 Tax=Cohnella candidum TaxID=2674991 RepID=A0A3G3JU55_9BACL|nr:hypothetical protein [Cohnella candidum]AYQ71381.1 hypothetical protein EAV92_01520 [Cohnella candidum]